MSFFLFSFYLHGDIFRNNGCGWIWSWLITFGESKFGPALALSNSLGYLPLLNLVMANHFELPVIIINAILCDNFMSISVLLRVGWQTKP